MNGDQMLPGRRQAGGCRSDDQEGGELLTGGRRVRMVGDDDQVSRAGESVQPAGPYQLVELPRQTAVRVHAGVGQNLPAGWRTTIALCQLDNSHHDPLTGFIRIVRRHRARWWRRVSGIVDGLHCTSPCLATVRMVGPLTSDAPGLLSTLLLSDMGEFVM